MRKYQANLSVDRHDYARLQRLATTLREISGVEVSIVGAVRYALDRAEDALNLGRWEKPARPRARGPVDGGLTGCVESEHEAHKAEEVHDGS